MNMHLRPLAVQTLFVYVHFIALDSRIILLLKISIQTLMLFCKQIGRSYSLWLVPYFHIIEYKVSGKKLFWLVWALDDHVF